ncbi:hypothetical protein ABIB68_008017 [Bradyrhizobium sp. F1.2.2]
MRLATVSSQLLLNAVSLCSNFRKDCQSSMLLAEAIAVTVESKN